MPTLSLQRLRHRGPDGSGQFVDHQVALGHTRLSIVDIEGGSQPLYSEDQQIVLIANGEIYNHVELRDDLRQRGYRFATRSDCEVLIYAYLAFGLDFLERIDGMFAIALYDRRKQRLLLARDRLGIKPLFIDHTPKRLAFASELKALLPYQDTRPEIEPHALGEYLQSNFSTGQTTVVKGIERVLPAQAMLVDTQGIERVWRYWHLKDTVPCHYSFGEASEVFGPLFKQSVSRHARSDVPVGLFLSGGNDSAIVLAMLSEVAGGAPIRTFSVGFEGNVDSELPQAASMAKRFGTLHTELVLEPEALFRELPQTVWAADELLGDYANLPTMKLAEAAGDLKVVFTGEGGDELFGGYGRYRQSGLRAIRHWLRGTWGRNFRGRGIFRGSWVPWIFRNELVEAMSSWRNPYSTCWDDTPSNWSNLQRMQSVDIATWLPDDLLVKVDRMLMYHGVEGRVPYLDHRLVEFGLSLPDRLKCDHRHGKRFLKQWAEKLIPREYLDAPKRGFTVPVNRWLAGDVLSRLETVLGASRAINDWCHPAGVRRLVAFHRELGRAAQPLLALLQFAIWHALFIEGDGSLPTADTLDVLA